MKRIIALVIIVFIIFFGLNVDLQHQKKTNQQDNNVNYTSTEIYFISSNYLDGLKYSAVRTNGISIIQYLLSSNQKFPFSEVFTSKNFELTNNNKISDYIYIAECNIKCFEGPDLIYPFNYFW